MHRTTRIHRTICCVALVAALVPLARAGSAAEIPDCLINPGVPDFLGFTHVIPLALGGETWYFAAPDIELQGIANQTGQPQDLPGHCWSLGATVRGQVRLTGKHYNTGPAGAGLPGRFWSSNAPSHDQLYWVDVIISRWTPRIAAERLAAGYVHYHEMVRAGDGCLHPRLVAWFRHTALRKFRFDGGAPQISPEGLPFRPRNVPHQVEPGVDRAFAPNHDLPYLPEERSCGLS